MHRLVCVHCATRHAVESLEAGRDPGAPPFFDETPLEHMAKHHPDEETTRRELHDLHRRIEKLPVEAFRLLNFELGNQTPGKGRH